MNRFSPKKLAEKFLLGVEQRKNELVKNAESILPTPSIKSLQESYNQQVMGTLPRTFIGGTIDVLDKSLVGALKTTDGLVNTGVSSLTFPFGLLGPRQQLFKSSSQFLQPSPIHSDFSSYSKKVFSDLSQTIIGYGGDDSKKWETGIGGAVKWATSSISNIGYNALTLRPIETTNALLKTGGDAFDLVKNTAFSTVPFASNLVFGGLKSIAKKSEKPSRNTQNNTEETPTNPPEEDFNPGDLF